MLTPDTAEARRLADVLDHYATGDEYQRPAEKAVAMLRAQADELERLRALDLANQGVIGDYHAERDALRGEVDLLRAQLRAQQVVIDGMDRRNIHQGREVGALMQKAADVQGERNANAILTDEVERLTAENERLRAQVAPAGLDDKRIDDLLCDIDQIARDRDMYEYGLPIDCTATDGPHEAMRAAVRSALSAAPAQQAEPCTCPSGDGSLRWPCPAHPAQSSTVGDRARALVEHLWKTDLKGIPFHLVADLKSALDAQPAAQAEPDAWKCRHCGAVNEVPGTTPDDNWCNSCARCGGMEPRYPHPSQPAARVEPAAWSKTVESAALLLQRCTGMDMDDCENLAGTIIGMAQQSKPPAQAEPVAYAVWWGLGFMRKHSVHFERATAEDVAANIKSYTEIRPLYAGPQAATAGDERRHVICLCPDCTKPAAQAEPVAPIEDAQRLWSAAEFLRAVWSQSGWTDDQIAERKFRVAYDLEQIGNRLAAESKPAAQGVDRQRLTKAQVDACWDGLMPSGHGKRRYDIARAIESAALAQAPAGWTDDQMVRFAWLVLNGFKVNPGPSILERLESFRAAEGVRGIQAPATADGSQP